MPSKKPTPIHATPDVLTTQQLAEMVGADQVSWVEEPAYQQHGTPQQGVNVGAALDALLVDMEAIPDQMAQAGLHGPMAELVDAYVQQKSVILATSSWFQKNAPLLRAIRERMERTS